MKETRSHTEMVGIANLLPDIWYCTDQDGILVQVSHLLEDDFGFDLTKVLGEPIGEILRNERQFDSLHKTAKTLNKVSDQVLEISNQGGKTLTVSVSCIWHEDKAKGGKGLLVGNIRDITTREEELRVERESYLNFVDVVNSTLDGMLIIDKMTQKVIDANHKALEILGLSMDEIKSIPISAATKANPEEMALFLELLEQNRDYRIERKVQHKNGNLIDLEISSRMMHVGEGMLFQSIIRDITLKKRLFKIEKLKEEVLSVKVIGLPDGGLIHQLCDQLEKLGVRRDVFYVSFESDECIFSKDSNIDTKLKQKIVDTYQVENQHFDAFRDQCVDIPIADFIFPIIDTKKESKSTSKYHSWASFPIHKGDDNPIGSMIILSKSDQNISDQELESMLQLFNILGSVYQKLDQEAQLVLSENRYRKLLDYSPLAIGIYAEDKVAFANQEFFNILKLDYTSTISKSDLMVFVPIGNRPHFKKMISTIIKYGSIPIEELTLAYPDGTPFTLMIQGTSVTYQNQEAIQFVFYDISDRKKFEIRLKDREILLNTTGSVAKVGGWQLTNSDRALKWTDQNFAIHGLEVVQDISLDRALSFYHSTDQDKIRKALDDCFKGAAFELTVRMKSASNELLWIEYSGRPIYENDKVVKLIGAQRDITQYMRQIEDIIESEQKLRNANHLARLGNWEWTVGTDLFYWSEELYQILDVPTTEIPTMELFEKILINDSHKIFYNILHQTLNGGSSAPYELTIQHLSTQQLKYISMQATSEVDNDGRISKISGTIQDITDRRKMELEKETINLYSKVLLELEALTSKSENIAELVEAYSLALVDQIKFDCVWIADHPNGSKKPVFVGMKSSQEGKRLAEEKVPIFFDSEPYKKAVSTGSLVVTDVENLSMSEPWEKLLKKQQTKSLIVVPFLREDKVRGTFSLLLSSPRSIDRPMRNFLSQLIHDCGNSIYALELKRNRDELNEYNKLLIDSLDVVSVSYDAIQDRLFVFGNTVNLVGLETHVATSMFEKGLESVHPNDINKIQGHIKHSKKNNGNFDVDFRVRTSGRKTVWLNAIGRIYWSGKEIRKVAGILINMDQRKQEEVNQVKTHISIRDQERIRIARELHDSLGQTLTIACMSLDAMSESVKQLSDDRQDLYQDAYKLVNNAIDETRTISHDLMPSLLMDFGLVKSIKSDIQKLNKAGKIAFEFEYDEVCDQRYAQEIELNYYNIIREAIKNIIKHSQASMAHIELRWSDDLLVLTIQDNGIGWDNNKTFASGGLGMNSLESRAVSLGAEYYVSGDNGCKIKIELDLND